MLLYEAAIWQRALENMTMQDHDRVLQVGSAVYAMLELKNGALAAGLAGPSEAVVLASNLEKHPTACGDGR